MLKVRCMPVLYDYKRKPLPNSKVWHMGCRKAAEMPSELSVGIVDVSNHRDRVGILIAVPCDEHGEVDHDTQAKYEDIADERFKELHPDAQLA